MQTFKNPEDFGFCIWLTGLSSSGKTTIAIALEKKLKNFGLKVERLDGDVVRSGLCSDLGFSREDRDRNIERVMFIANLLTRNGICVIASFISPYRAAREAGKKLIKNFIEVFVKCPIEVCEERDSKGLYKKAKAGEILQFTGVSDPYQKPENPDLILETCSLGVNDCVQKICDCLIKKKLFPEEV